MKPINAVRETATGSRSPAGPRRLGTATRMNASLSRRLSVFFVSTPGQGPKAAKYAVLTPGPGMFVNVRNAPRAVIAPPPETPPVSPCKPLCARLGAGVACVPAAVPRNERCGVCVRCGKRPGKYRPGDGELILWGCVFLSRSCPVSEAFAPCLPVRLKHRPAMYLSSRNFVWDTRHIFLVVSHNSINDRDHLPAGVAHGRHIGFPFIPFFLKIKL